MSDCLAKNTQLLVMNGSCSKNTNFYSRMMVVQLIFSFNYKWGRKKYTKF